MNKNFFKNKKVLVLGHNGFKGSWLAQTLLVLKAKVFGVSLPNKESKSLFAKNNLSKKITEYNFNIQNEKILKKTILKIKPDIIFHLAAQSLVKESYLDPLNTWKTNLLGTVNLLESLRFLKKNCLVVIITSDKCYNNKELLRGYKETDELGGKDPYSASKGAAEIAIRSYKNSYFLKNSNIKIASARAGNVIGGGDWNEGRIIPDCFKSWLKNKTIKIRQPNSTRPWQHVLDVISGYLTLAYKLKYNQKIHGEAFNFGPKSQKDYTVLNLVDEIKKNLKNFYFKKNQIHKTNFKEAKLLKLNSKKSNLLLGWSPILDFSQTAKFTAEWYSFLKEKKNTTLLSLNQIKIYLNLFKKKNKWI